MIRKSYSLAPIEHPSSELHISPPNKKNLTFNDTAYVIRK